MYFVSISTNTKRQETSDDYLTKLNSPNRATQKKEWTERTRRKCFASGLRVNVCERVTGLYAYSNADS